MQQCPNSSITHMPNISTLFQIPTFRHNQAVPFQYGLANSFGDAHSSPNISPQANRLPKNHKSLLDTLVEANTASHCRPFGANSESRVLPPPNPLAISLIPNSLRLPTTASVSLPWLLGRDCSAMPRALSSPASPSPARTSLHQSSCPPPASAARNNRADTPAAAGACGGTSEAALPAGRAAGVDVGGELSRYVAAFAELTREVRLARIGAGVRPSTADPPPHEGERAAAGAARRTRPVRAGADPRRR